MLDEWLIYGKERLLSLSAQDYDWWAVNRASKSDLQQFPVVARGLTRAQADMMIELTKEQEDDDEI